MSNRLDRFKESGLMGCFNGTGITSGNYKEFVINDYERWIPEAHKPQTFQDVLAVVSYLDAAWNEKTGGYDPEKSFWTDPVIVITKFNGKSWSCSGKVSHWMPLPEPPKE